MSSLCVPSCAFPTWQQVCGRAPGAGLGRGTGVGVPTAASCVINPAEKNMLPKEKYKPFHRDFCMFKMRRRQKRCKLVLLSFEITDLQSHTFGVAG